MSPLPAPPRGSLSALCLRSGPAGEAPLWASARLAGSASGCSAARLLLGSARLLAWAFGLDFCLILVWLDFGFGWIWIRLDFGWIWFDFGLISV